MTDELQTLAAWDTAYINNLPDSAFLYIEPGGTKDSENKTVPRSNRHFPVHDASGAVDMPHLRNALARIPQSSLPQDVKDRMTAMAQAMLARANQQSDDDNLMTLDLPDERLETFSVTQRKLGLRIVPWNTVADSKYGPIMFEPGAFGDVNPSDVRLRMDHADPPTGLGATYQERPEGAYMDFQVSKTQRGDEQLTLAVDGVSKGASVGFRDIPGAVRLKSVDGRRVRVYPPNSAKLEEVSTTWQPTFNEAGVMYVLSRQPEPKGEPEVTEAAASEPIVQIGPDVTEALKTLGANQQSALDRMIDRLERMEENQRKQISVPHGENEESKPKLWNWAEQAIRMLRGQSVSAAVLKELALDDVVTSENPGLVPDVLSRDFDDLIRTNRPFLESCRQITPPTTGMSLLLPYITTRAVAGAQSAEKSDITGTVAPKVGTLTFPYEAVFGGADVAIQMLNRADASFFDLLTQELAEAYALDCDEKAVADLLSPADGNAGSPDDGGTIDPENLTVGGAWQTAITVYRRAPDTIWMNSAAAAAFIDAKSPVTNGPLYSDLAANFTAGGGPSGTISGLRPIYVPALDGAEVDVIIGPSRSLVWAEDPARTLQVDVPSKAGRDIALVGGVFVGPRYAAAFTTYTLGS